VLIDLGPQEFTVAPTVTLGGNITPALPHTVIYKETATFTITPASGFVVKSVTGCGGSLSGNSYTTGPITGNCTVAASFIWSGTCDSGATSPNCPRLNVTLSGTGSGSVSFMPSGTACLTGVCTSAFPYGMDVTLMATSSATSIFAGWSGACTNESANCTIAMNSDRSVSATFTSAYKAQIGSVGYNSLAAAYAGATEGAQILLLDADLLENLTIDRGIAVTLQGGYYAGFVGRSGRLTNLKGILTIRNGRLRVDRLAVN
jgi:hypothetical protein